LGLTEHLDTPKLDFNGDGKSDIFWRNSDGSESAIWIMDGVNIDESIILQGNPDGFSPSGSFFPLPQPSGWFPMPEDFNGDGKTDFIWQNNDTSPSRYAIWIMDSGNIVDGTFLQSGATTDALWFNKSADFNGDGKTDVYWRKITGDGQNAI
jgi:hypothetical protein